MGTGRGSVKAHKRRARVSLTWTQTLAGLQPATGMASLLVNCRAAHAAARGTHEIYQHQTYARASR